MPIVVSDAGPLIHLAQINKLILVKSLFGSAIITSKVKDEAFDEGIRLGFDDAEIIGEALREGWILVESLSEGLTSVAAKLAKGENISTADAETLLLATEKKMELLVDEKILSNLAKMHGLHVWTTWTVLLEALDRDLIAYLGIESAIEELERKRHKLSRKNALDVLKAARFVRSKKKIVK